MCSCVLSGLEIMLMIDFSRLSEGKYDQGDTLVCSESIFMLFQCLMSRATLTNI